MDNHPTGWPLLYEAPLGMICLYGKVMTYTALLLQIETEMAKSERKYNGAGYNSAEAEANV